MNWDEYFLKIACETGQKSKCMSRKIGAVLVVDGKFIIGTGYNDPPMRVRPCYDSLVWLERFDGNPPKEIRPPVLECPRRLMGFPSGKGLHLCPAAHAERNAIDIAARRGIVTSGTTLYLTCIAPCLECAKSIIQAGIFTVVVTAIEPYEQEPISGLQLLLEAGICVRTYECDTEAILKAKNYK